MLPAHTAKSGPAVQISASQGTPKIWGSPNQLNNQPRCYGPTHMGVTTPRVKLLCLWPSSCCSLLPRRHPCLCTVSVWCPLQNHRIIESLQVRTILCDLINRGSPVSKCTVGKTLAVTQSLSLTAEPRRLVPASLQRPPAPALYHWQQEWSQSDYLPED